MGNTKGRHAGLGYSMRGVWRTEAIQGRYRGGNARRSGAVARGHPTPLHCAAAQVEQGHPLPRAVGPLKGDQVPVDVVALVCMRAVPTYDNV